MIPAAKEYILGNNAIDYIYVTHIKDDSKLVIKVIKRYGNLLGSTVNIETKTNVINKIKSLKQKDNQNFQWYIPNEIDNLIVKFVFKYKLEIKVIINIL